jgi:dephospho-CoA kinase
LLLVGLTGGIGSGKSTVGRMLAEKGAVVIDADELARRAVDPGTPGFRQVLEAFGREIVDPDGAIDRERLAALVFGDPEARRRLEEIVHPEVARMFAEAVEPHRGTDQVVVYVVPLLVENRLQGAFDVVVTVSAEADLRAERLLSRQMQAEDARARMASQASDEEREQVADLVIRNDRSLSQLGERVEELWRRLAARPGG